MFAQGDCFYRSLCFPSDLTTRSCLGLYLQLRLLGSSGHLSRQAGRRRPPSQHLTPPFCHRDQEIWPISCLSLAWFCFASVLWLQVSELSIRQLCLCLPDIFVQQINEKSYGLAAVLTSPFYLFIYPPPHTHTAVLCYSCRIFVDKKLIALQSLWVKVTAGCFSLFGKFKDNL